MSSFQSLLLANDGSAKDSFALKSLETIALAARSRDAFQIRLYIQH